MTANPRGCFSGTQPSEEGVWASNSGIEAEEPLRLSLTRHLDSQVRDGQPHFAWQHGIPVGLLISDSTTVEI